MTARRARHVNGPHGDRGWSCCFGGRRWLNWGQHRGGGRLFGSARSSKAFQKFGLAARHRQTSCPKRFLEFGHRHGLGGFRCHVALSLTCHINVPPKPKWGGLDEWGVWASKHGDMVG